MKKLFAKMFGGAGVSIAEKLGGVVDKFVRTKDEKAEFEKQMTEIFMSHELSLEKEITSRHAADMQSDSWLSKNIRPLLTIFSLVLYTLFAISDGNIGEFNIANQYVDHNEPWVLAKENVNEKEVIKIASTALNLFRILNICLEPIIPETAFKIKKYLNLIEDNFEHIAVSVKNHEIQSFKPLIERIEDDKIDNLIEASKSG